MVLNDTLDDVLEVLTEFVASHCGRTVACIRYQGCKVASQFGNLRGNLRNFFSNSGSGFTHIIFVTNKSSYIKMVLNNESDNIL